MSAGVEVGPAPNSHGLTALPERATRPPSDAGRVGENLSQLGEEPPCRPLELLVPLGQKQSVSVVQRQVNPRKRPFVPSAIPASCRIRSGGTSGTVPVGEGGLTDLAIADLPKGHGRQTLRGQSDGCYSSASRPLCTRISPTVTKVRVILYGTTPLYLWPLAVFNFWEPLHLFDRGYGFQTWEVSPKYSIRSWAYIVLHWFPVQLSKIFIGPDKVRLPPQL